MYFILRTGVVQERDLGQEIGDQSTPEERGLTVKAEENTHMHTQTCAHTHTHTHLHAHTCPLTHIQESSWLFSRLPWQLCTQAPSLLSPQKDPAGSSVKMHSALVFKATCFAKSAWLFDLVFLSEELY